MDRESGHANRYIGLPEPQTHWPGILEHNASTSSVAAARIAMSREGDTESSRNNGITEPQGKESLSVPVPFGNPPGYEHNPASNPPSINPRQTAWGGLVGYNASKITLTPPPTVMSWEGDDESSRNSRIVESQAQAFANLPGNASRPIGPINYSFSPGSGNSTMLTPPTDAADSRPLYNISVCINCFNPSVMLTKIRRGATENGRSVGEFQMCRSGERLSFPHGKVLMYGTENWIDNVFKKNSSSRWHISLGGKDFLWEFTKSANTCYSRDRQITYAKFLPASTSSLRDEANPLDLTQLEVFPPGQDLLDQLLVSVLILEQGGVRKREQPSSRSRYLGL